jgi:hypothetical protein
VRRTGGHRRARRCQIEAPPRRSAGTSLAETAGVRRFLLVLALLASGCGTSGYHQGFGGRSCTNPTGAELAFLVAELAVGALQAGAGLTETMREPEPPRVPLATRRPFRRIFGTVSWEAGGRVAAIPVTLRGSSGLVVLETRTDEGGRFWFPLPLPGDWYRISVDDQRAAGESKVWLHDRPPDYLDVIAHPKEAPPTD